MNRCWKCNDNRPCNLEHCGLKENFAVPPEKMSDEQIAGALGFSVMSETAIAYLAIGRAIETARDAQWQARLDAAVAAGMERWHEANKESRERTIYALKYVHDIFTPVTTKQALAMASVRLAFKEITGEELA